MDGVDPEITVGRALRNAGTFAARVKHFRDGAIGFVPYALYKERQAMVDDLASAQKLLEEARDCLGPATPRRWWRLRQLRKRVEQLEHPLGDRELKTPLNYGLALAQAATAEQGQLGPDKDGNPAPV